MFDTHTPRSHGSLEFVASGSRSTPSWSRSPAGSRSTCGGGAGGSFGSDHGRPFDVDIDLDDAAHDDHHGSASVIAAHRFPRSSNQQHHRLVKMSSPRSPTTRSASTRTSFFEIIEIRQGFAVLILRRSGSAHRRYHQPQRHQDVLAAGSCTSSPWSSRSASSPAMDSIINQYSLPTRYLPSISLPADPRSTHNSSTYLDACSGATGTTPCRRLFEHQQRLSCANSGIAA